MSNRSDAGEPTETVDPEADAEFDYEGDQATPRDDLIAESKKYRQRAQQAEADRDELRERLETAQRRQAVSLGTNLAQATDIFNESLGGADLADLLNDDGHVDPDKVAEVAERIIRTRPGLAKPGGSRPLFPNAGQGAQRRPGEKSSGKTWGDVLKPPSAIS